MMTADEIDKIIATKVMGWKILSHWEPGVVKHLIDENQCEVYPPEFKKYSTDTSAALEVANEIMGDEQFHFGLFAEWPTKWHCEFSAWSGVQNGYFQAYEETAALSICMAALRARGILK